ncbi:hypothetical protein H2O64_15590 [Kordia sp. YSTF-M3]|uniref:GLPGLI family protein n=1 Tax=Kordia aestuariivivens TaxID=2759037 RepID=A0ABR7QC07_9FLAO|nr:hypothetical protein [Kordia aestuariivivens]MBC8756100.1 hypothetical protein [Kordia aestuariivivens]
MRKIYVCMMFLFLGLCMTAQTKNVHYNFQEHQVDNFINEVYGDQAQKLIFSNQNLYRAFKKLILERMQIVRKSEIQGKKVPKITDQGMFDTYTSGLQHDAAFNISNFNPLKYKLAFFDAASHRMYSIDNTDYILIIQPQPKLQN